MGKKRIQKLDPGVLKRTLERSRKVGRAGVVVFDLDSTLLDNRPRQAKILREFGELHAVAALRNLRADHFQSWSIREAMQHAGWSADEVERWAEPAKAFWRDHFFTSEYCVVDQATAGAVSFLGALAETEVQIAYCTGRHEPMRVGSVESFRRL